MMKTFLTLLSIGFGTMFTKAYPETSNSFLCRYSVTVQCRGRVVGTHTGYSNTCSEAYSAGQLWGRAIQHDAGC